MYQYFLFVLTVNSYCYTTFFTISGIVEIQQLSNSVVLEQCGQVYVSLIGSLPQFSTKIQMACCAHPKTACSVPVTCLYFSRCHPFSINSSQIIISVQQIKCTHNLQNGLFCRSIMHTGSFFSHGCMDQGSKLACKCLAMNDRQGYNPKICNAFQL